MDWKKKLNKLFSDVPSKVIGIDIGSGNIKLVQLDLGGKKPIVTNYVAAELPAEMANNGYIRTGDAMAGFMKGLLEKNGFTAKHCVFAIGGRNAFVREIEVPQMPDEEMRQSVIWDAGQYVPYEANSYYADAAKFGSPNPESGMQSVLLVAAPKEMVDTLLEIADVLELRPICVDIEVLACYRVLKAKYQDFIILDIGRSYSLITIFQGGAPVAQRSIPQGGQMMDSALADSCSCTLAEVEQLKRNEDILGTTDETLKLKYKPVFDVVEDMDREIHRTCEYYKINKKNAVFTNMVLTGGGAAIKGLKQLLDKDSEVPVSVLDVRDMVGFDSRYSRDDIAEIRARGVVAIGTAMAGGEHND